ncbi:MAG: hypothetical protein IJR85_08365 [Synergistaceae bacterium]|nr:hypothetical protein [Synergistaceae bacterium]
MTNKEFTDFVVIAASSAEITYTILQEDNGSWTCWSNELTLTVNAPTKEQMYAEMSESLKTWADSYVNDPEKWGKAHPELLAYAVKVLTDEEMHNPAPEIPVRKYALYLKDTGNGGMRYTNFPADTDDEIMPPKYWEHKRTVDFWLTDIDLDEEEE